MRRKFLYLEFWIITTSLPDFKTGLILRKNLFPSFWLEVHSSNIFFGVYHTILVNKGSWLNPLLWNVSKRGINQEWPCLIAHDLIFIYLNHLFIYLNHLNHLYLFFFYLNPTRCILIRTDEFYSINDMVNCISKLNAV